MPLSTEELAQVENRFVTGSQHFGALYADCFHAPTLTEGIPPYGHHLKKVQLEANREWWFEHGCPSVLLAMFTGTEPEAAWNFMDADSVAPNNFGYYLDYYEPGSEERQKAWDLYFAPAAMKYALLVDMGLAGQVETYEDDNDGGDNVTLLGVPWLAD